MILNDYEEICNKFKTQSTQFERLKEEHSKSVENMKYQEENFKDEGKKPGIGKNKQKKQLRSGKNEKNEREEMINDLQIF